MPCKRGQAEPDRHTTLRLFADSGGFCQRPECPNRLFVDTATKNIHLAEMAHIIAAGKNGPRADTSITQAEKGAYDNLILLCANCHTTIDKALADFPDDMIRQWKRRHVERIRSLFGAVEYPDRVSVRTEIEPALIENRFVFDQYGPHNDYRKDPESELANVWQRKMRAVILPNNRKFWRSLTQIAVTSTRLRRKRSKRSVSTLNLEAKHIGAGSGDVASCFPPGMSDILRETQHG